MNRIRTGSTSDGLARGLVERLAAAGSDMMFGVPGGGANLDLVGAANAAGIRFVLTHGETAAAIMAGTYAELRGVPTPCVVTRGPGAAAAVNGVAQALLERQPLVLVTDTVPAGERNRITHQYLDQPRMFAPVTKWSTPVGGPEWKSTVDAALATTVGGRPGPVHLDIDPGNKALPAAPPPAPPPDRSGLATARALLRGAHRPVVLLGVGALRAVDAVRALIRDTDVPVLPTYKAKGVVPDSWPHIAGVLTGATAEAELLGAADLILTIGLDTVELIPGEWPYPAPVVAVAAWPADDDYLPRRVELVDGDLAALVDALAVVRPDTSWPAAHGATLRAQVLETLRCGPPARTGAVTPTQVVTTAVEVTPAGAVATVDAGAHMLAAMHAWQARSPGDVLISSGLATMGYALPAAIAAGLARPGAPVVCLVGDGGLGMTLAELETVARLGLPVVVVVFNDGRLSLIEAKQRPERHGGPEAVRYLPTRFADIALACGMAGATIDTVDGLRAALRTALAAGRPTLLDVTVDPGSYPHVLRTLRG